MKYTTNSKDKLTYTELVSNVGKISVYTLENDTENKFKGKSIRADLSYFMPLENESDLILWINKCESIEIAFVGFNSKIRGNAKKDSCLLDYENKNPNWVSPNNYIHQIKEA